MTPGGTFELCCVYIAELMTHTALHTTFYLAVMLQASWHTAEGN